MEQEMKIPQSGRVHSRLARGPAHRAAAQKVKVQMKDGLPGFRSGIDDGAVSGGEVELAGQFGGNPVQMAKHRLIGFPGFLGRCEMLSGNYQDVHRSLRIDVMKSNRGFILVHDPGRNLLGHDFAKNALGHCLSQELI
jgi:hypothetical protein